MCRDQMRGHVWLMDFLCLSKRKYGKPHQEFVKILCTYKDIFELRKRVEAFDLQYEMHASSYQRDCLRIYRGLLNYKFWCLKLYRIWSPLSPTVSSFWVTLRLDAWQCFRLFLQPDQWSALWGSGFNYSDSIDVGWHKMKHTMQLKKTWQEATKRSVPRMAGSTLLSKSSVARYLFIACLQASSRRMSF